MKYLTLIIALLLSSSVVLAQQTTNQGVLPNSIFYKLDLLFEDFKVNSASNDLERAELRLANSEERMQEIELVTDSDSINKAITAYNKDVGGVRDFAEKAKANKMNITAFEAKARETIGKHAFVLQRVLENAPEQAQKGLMNALNASTKPKMISKPVMGVGISG